MCVLTLRKIIRIQELPKSSFVNKTLDELRIGTYENMQIVTENTRIILVLKKFVFQQISAVSVVDENGKLNLAANKTSNNLDATSKTVKNNGNGTFNGVQNCKWDQTLFTVMEKFVTILSKKLLKSLQIDEDGNLLENTQKAFPHDIISRRVSNMRQSKIDKKMRDQVLLDSDSNIINHSSTIKNNINDDIILDLSGESSSRHDTNDTPQIISNIQTVEENDTLPKNLFWIPKVTESQIAWQKRILDSMIASYNQQKAKGFRMEVTEIEKELFTEREDKVKIAPDWGCYIRKGSWLHQILGRHNAGNWTKIVLEIMIEIYGSGNLKYMSAKGTRNTIGVNQNLRCAIMDLLLKMNVNTTEKQLTTVINKFCSNRKSAKRPVTNTSMEGRDAMPRAKRHAPSTRVTVEHGGHQHPDQ
ncbi:hypothetical protein PV328_004236 [Microctonus aethiopoides]|uniref:BEN domain-containing protein n=1 Tax=Microctonus aethiopoides TaxID=144406 RepID=A0AA39FA59_9HYME|nr:hypothetical protein PV328_004236 [Microctonus aethiopoides]